MDEIEKLKFEIKRLQEENELLRNSYSKRINDISIVEKNAEAIIMKSINMAYDIRIELKKMLESLKGKTYEEGIKIIGDFVSNNKYFLGNDLKESKEAVKEFVHQLVDEIKE